MKNISTNDIEKNLELLDLEITHLRRVLAVSGLTPLEISSVLASSTAQINLLNRELNKAADDWAERSEISK